MEPVLFTIPVMPMDWHVFSNDQCWNNVCVHTVFDGNEILEIILIDIREWMWLND